MSSGASGSVWPVVSTDAPSALPLALSNNPDDIHVIVELIADHIVQNMSPFMKAAVSAEVPARNLIWWSDNHTPQDLMKMNVEFLKGVLLYIPTVVPSAYTIGSVLMTVDSQLGGVLFRTMNPMASETDKRAEKMKLALGEAAHGKQLIQMARLAARNGPASRDPVIQELKSMIIFAPKSNSEKPKVPRTVLSPLSVPAHSPTEVDDIHDTNVVPSMPGTDEPVIPPSLPQASALVLPLPRDPPSKKARVLHNEAPDFVNGVVASLQAASTNPLATPKAQLSQPRPAAEKYEVEKQVIPDETRSIPANFDETIHASYMRLPERALPQGGCQGKFNYSIKDTTGALIEVQLKNRIFRVIRTTGGQMWNQFLNGSANVPWRNHDSIEQSFDKTLELAGGWVV
jgi:hypothetical protein